MLKKQLLESLESVPDDEPLFVLRGRASEDIGSDLVRMWARRYRGQPDSDAAFADNAMRVADAMDAYRKSDPTNSGGETSASPSTSSDAPSSASGPSENEEQQSSPPAGEGG